MNVYIYIYIYIHIYIYIGLLERIGFIESEYTLPFTGYDSFAPEQEFLCMPIEGNVYIFVHIYIYICMYNTYQEFLCMPIEG
jgi:hypothetical protein